MKANKPKVSVVTICYNQDKYIKQCIDSIASQKTDFDIELIISDDGSSDKTQQILKEMYEKYPHVIRPILRKKNIGAWNNFVDALNHAEGEYIALCEGDDYWTDESKLQQQVDFLESHKDYTVSFHKVKIVYEGSKKTEFFPDETYKPYNLQNLLKKNFIQTNSVVYRRQAYGNLEKDILPGDWYMHLLHAKNGKIHFTDKPMSVYRRHKGGIWWNSNHDIDTIWQKYGIQHLNMFLAARNMFNDSAEYKTILDEHITDTIGRIISSDKSKKNDSWTEVMQKFPTEFDRYLKEIRAEYLKQIEDLNNAKIEIQSKKAKIFELNNHIQDLQKDVNELNMLIDRMRNSRVWKFRNKIAKILGKGVI